MINIKKTINFKTIRDKGPKAIDIKKDEVVQIVSANKDILYVVTQDFLMELLSAQNLLLINAGLKKEEIIEINFEEKQKELKKRFEKICKLSQEDKDSFNK